MRGGKRIVKFDPAKSSQDFIYIIMEYYLCEDPYYGYRGSVLCACLSLNEAMTYVEKHRGLASFMALETPRPDYDYRHPSCRQAAQKYVQIREMKSGDEKQKILFDWNC